jgi:DNA-directed RNA polymerase subunit H (RpoH/RPB5)
MALKTKIVDPAIINKLVLQNIKIMLDSRKRKKHNDPDISDEEYEEVTIIEDHDNNDIFIVDDVHVYIVPISISNISITTKSTIGEFLKNTSIKHKIVVLKSPSKRIIQYIISLNNNFIEGKISDNIVEVFTEVELMKNYNKIKFIPKHIIMTEEEINNEIIKTDIPYLPTINSNDIMVRWIGAIPNNIIKIIGYSITSGYRINYRRVRYVLYT